MSDPPGVANTSSEDLPVDRVLSILSLDRLSFHELSMRHRVLLSQAPFAITMTVLVAGLWVAHESLRAQWQVQLTLALTVALTAACALVPWHRLPDGAFLGIAALDFLPIVLLREGAQPYLAGAGILAAFPVIWLTASGRLPRAGALLGFLLSLAMVWTPLVVPWRGLSPEALLSPLLIPFMLLGIGITVQVLSTSMERQNAQLQEKDARLEHLLAESARRERLLHGIVEAVDVGVLAIDAEGHDILMNQRQHLIHQHALPPGLRDGPEAHLELYADGDGTPLPAEDRVAARAVRGESFSDVLVWVGRPPAQLVLSISAKAMLDEHGHREGTVLAFSDVTDLVAALRAKDDFLAGVSHELRTPLTSIRGYTELLAMDDSMPEDVHAGLQVIERNADQLSTLIDDLLGTTTGPAELHPVPADLVEIVRQSVAAAEVRAAEAGVDLHVETPSRLELHCDPVRIGQVLDNLLSNAVKYSPDGGPVTVRASRVAGELRCEVADHGTGLSGEDTENVFGRFFRSRQARQSRVAGLGLGLSIAEQIVEQHGGRIRCDSVLGEGTVFTMTLPGTGARGAGVAAAGSWGAEPPRDPARPGAAVP